LVDTNIGADVVPGSNVQKLDPRDAFACIPVLQGSVKSVVGCMLFAKQKLAIVPTSYTCGWAYDWYM